MFKICNEKHNRRRGKGMDQRTLMDFNAIAYMADHYGDFTPEVNAKIIRWSEGQDVFYTREGKDFLKRLYAINKGQALEDDCVICGRRARNGVVCGRCVEQYIEIDEEDDDTGYEPQYSSSDQRKNNNNTGRQRNTKNNESRWATGKLIIGIVSIVLFFVVMMQSCAAGISNALESNGEASGSFGFISAILFLIAGIVGVCVRKKGLAAQITTCVFYYLVFFMAAVGSGSYSDLKVWGVIAFIFGAVFLFSAIYTKKGYIISGIVSALVFLICITSMATSSSKKESEVSNTDLANVSVSGDVTGTENKDLAQSEDNNNDMNIGSDTSASLPSISETVLLDNSGIVIKAVEMIEDSIWGPGVKLYIENNSDKNVNIYCDAVIVNDYMISDLFSTSVAAGKKTNENLNLFSSSLKAAGIDNIGKIELYFNISDSDTFDTIYKSDCVTIQTSEYASMDVTPNDVGLEILNQDGVRVVAKYVDENTFWGKSILLYLENNSQKNVTISIDNMSINGYMVTPFFVSSVYSGKKAINDISLLSSDLEANGITSVDDVELTFRVYDTDTYDDIISAETISFSTH